MGFDGETTTNNRRPRAGHKRVAPPIDMLGPPHEQAYSFKTSHFCAQFQTLAPLINAWPPSVDCSSAGSARA